MGLTGSYHTLEELKRNSYGHMLCLQTSGRQAHVQINADDAELLPVTDFSLTETGPMSSHVSRIQFTLGPVCFRWAFWITATQLWSLVTTHRDRKKNWTIAEYETCWKLSKYLSLPHLSGRCRNWYRTDLQGDITPLSVMSPWGATLL